MLQPNPMLALLPSSRGRIAPPTFGSEPSGGLGQGISGLLGSAFRKRTTGPAQTSVMMGDDPVTPGQPQQAVPLGLMGQRSRGVVATPQQEEESAEAAGRLGIPQDAMVTDWVGHAPDAPKTFWQGGKKFTGRDALAAALAVVGDAFARQNGSPATASANLGKERASGLDAFKEAVENYQKKQQMAKLPGMSAREFAAWEADPKAWGGHMADAYSSHHAAANVNPGDQRLYGNPNEGGDVYQAPTAAEQYAASLGIKPVSDDYETALQDYTLRANGPTAYGYDVQLDDHRTANDMSVERLRQAGRLNMEGVRQENRLDVRGTPTYRDLNPPARAVRENLPVVSSPAEARKLPRGTRFKTPDGRVKIVP